MGSSLQGSFSETAEQKQTPLVPFVALLEIRIILKNEANRWTVEGVIAKTMYRTKLRKSEVTSVQRPN